MKDNNANSNLMQGAPTQKTNTAAETRSTTDSQASLNAQTSERLNPARGAAAASRPKVTPQLMLDYIALERVQLAQQLKELMQQQDELDNKEGKVTHCLELISLIKEQKKKQVVSCQKIVESLNEVMQRMEADSAKIVQLDQKATHQGLTSDVLLQTLKTNLAKGLDQYMSTLHQHKAQISMLFGFDEHRVTALMGATTAPRANSSSSAAAARSYAEDNTQAHNNKRSRLS